MLTKRRIAAILGIVATASVCLLASNARRILQGRLFPDGGSRSTSRGLPESRLPDHVEKLLNDEDLDTAEEIDETLRRASRSLRSLCFDTFLPVLAEDFRGTVFLEPPPLSTPPRECGDAKVVNWKSEGGSIRDRAGFLATLIERTRDFALCERWKLKMGTFEINGPQAKAQLNTETIFLRNDGGRVHVQEQYEGRFQKHEDQWKIVRLDLHFSRWVSSVRPVFHNIAASAGVSGRFTPSNDGRLMPAGIALGDYDGDGWVDLFVCGPVPRLFRNRGDGTFEDVTLAAGIPLKDASFCASAVWFDYDGDGLLDLLIGRAARTYAGAEASTRELTLLRNLGNGKFEDVTEKAGLVISGDARSLTVGDIDGRGFLSIYVCEDQDRGRGLFSLFPNDPTNDRKKTPDRLWRNNGDGTFTEVARLAGVDNRGWSLAAAFADYDRDGHADLMVINEWGRNVLYRNNGDGTFRDVTESAGAVNLGFGMGVSFLDYDGDGNLDVYISNMYSNAGMRLLARKSDLPQDIQEKLKRMAFGNTLLRNRGDGTFEDVSRSSATNKAGWAWGNVAVDYDADGWTDLYVANGWISGSTDVDL